MNPSTFLRPAAVLMALTALAGCGQSSLLSALGADSLAFAGRNALKTTGTMQSLGTQGDRQGDRPGGDPMSLFANLDLSDAQKAAIQTLVEADRPAKPDAKTQRPSRPENALPALLAAEVLDESVVRAALVSCGDMPGGDAKPDRTADLVALRAVLTDAQIATLVAQMEAAPSEPPHRTAADAGDKPEAKTPPTAAERAAQLNLTAAQTDLFLAFEAKMEANRPAKPVAGDMDPHSAHQAAELAFWKSGDTTALTAAEPAKSAPPAFPVDEFVALAASLNVEQRQQLLAPDPRGGQHRGPGGEGFGGLGGDKMGRGEGPGRPMHGGGGPRGEQGDRPAKPQAEPATEAAV